MTTFIFTLLVFALLLFPMALWALFLGLGLRWAHATDVTVRRVLWATVLVVLTQLSVQIVALVLMASVDSLELLIGVAGLGLQLCVPFVVIMRVFQISFVRSLQAWLPTLAAPLIMVAVILLVIRPYVYEAYKAATNSMAPTLLGRHWTAACTECGSPAFCTPVSREHASMNSWRMICRDNFHVTQPAEFAEQVDAPDRLVVAKFLHPRRWDIIVFQYPEDPSVFYVLRLVGLPGEEITISDGHVHVDGELLSVPESIRNIKYDTGEGEWFRPMWGTTERPAKLGDDEFFVLGDFSPQAKDSRWWEIGAEGHHPYAVPRSHLKGVVTHTYWPPSRWRVFR